MSISDGSLGDGPSTVTIGTFTNVNDNPVMPVDTTVNVDENTTLVGTFTGTDEDIGQTLTYSLSGTDAALFNIDSGTGEVNFIAAPDYETPLDADSNNVYEITVTATDDGAGTLSDSQNVSITVLNINGTLSVVTTSDVLDGDTSSIEALNANMGADGVISLREAIEAANNTAGVDTIQFEIADPLVGGQHTISLGSALPIITEGIILDGTSDSDYAGSPLIVLDGTSAGTVDGVTINSTGSTVDSLVVQNFSGDGIAINGSDNQILNSQIVDNTGSGVVIDGAASDNNTILSTTFGNNGGLAIDLSGDGVTTSDYQDIDTGANGLQNFPVIDSVTTDGTDTTVQGVFTSQPNSTYLIELYSATTGDVSGFGEGETLLGTATVTTSADGIATFNVTLGGVSLGVGEVITATATEDLGGGNYGSTSEFSAYQQVTPNAPASITLLEGPMLTATEAADGTVARVSLIGSLAEAGDTVTLNWGATPINYTLTAADITNGFADITVAAGQIGGDGVTTVTASIDHAGISSPLSTESTIAIDQTAPDTVALAVAGTYNSATPTISGTAEPLSQISVTIDPDNNPATLDSFTLNTTANADGTWSVTIPGVNALADGATFSVTANATDANGNTSGDATTTATIDLTAPNSPTVASPGNLTGDSTPTFAGTAEPGAEITITIDADGDPATNNTVTLMTIADGLGNWSVDVPPADAITSGTATYSVTATDAAGNTSGATGGSVTFDVNAPTSPITAIADYVNTPTPTLSGLAEPGSTVEVTIDPDNNPATNDSFTLTTTAAADGSWNVTVPGANALTEGATAGVEVTATDAAGNVSPTTTDSFIVDTIAPTEPTSTIPGTITSATPTLSGTAEPSATVTLTIDPDNNPDTNNSFVLETTADGSGNWSVTVPVEEALTNGNSISYTVDSSDAAGNASPTLSGTSVVVLGPTATPVITSPTLVNDATPTVTGTAPAGAIVEVTFDLDNDPVTYNSLTLTTTADANGVWSITLPDENALADGTTAGISVTSDTGGGPSAPTTGTITTDLTAPAAPISTINDIVTSTTPTLTGTAEPYSEVIVVLDPDNDPTTANAVTLTTTTNADGTWNLNVPATAGLVDGATAAVSITATDTAGNVSTATTDSFLIDSTAPTSPSITSPNTISDTTPTLSGTGEVGSTVTVTIDPDNDPTTDNAIELTTTVDGNGNWSVTVPDSGALPDGTIASVTAVATDAGGSTSPASSSTLIIDTTAPTAPATTIPAAPNTTTPTFSGTTEPNSTVTVTIDPDNDPTTDNSVTLETTADANGNWTLTVPGGTLTEGSTSSVSITSDR